MDSKFLVALVVAGAALASCGCTGRSQPEAPGDLWGDTNDDAGGGAGGAGGLIIDDASASRANDRRDPRLRRNQPFDPSAAH